MSDTSILMIDNNRDFFDCSINIKFAEYIENNKIKRNSVAKGVNVHPCSITQALNNRMRISHSLRYKLNEYLGTDF